MRAGSGIRLHSWNFLVPEISILQVVSNKKSGLVTRPSTLQEKRDAETSSSPSRKESRWKVSKQKPKFDPGDPFSVDYYHVGYPIWTFDNQTGQLGVLSMPGKINHQVMQIKGV